MSKQLDSFFKSFMQSEEQLEYRLAHEVVGQKVPVISTGSLLLDDALSCGGIPTGRIIQFYGRASSGKTLMTMLTMKEAQKLNPDSKQLFIDAEQTFSPDWAETLGLDTSRIIVVDGDLAANGRRCFEMLLGVPKEDAKHILIGKKTEGLFDKISKGELDINLVILDSLGAIIPPGEDVSAVGKANMALLSRFLTPTFRKLSLEVSKAKIPMIVINHTRDNMDPYGVDHTFSGGNTYNHSLSANVYFEAVTRKDAQILDEKENKIGHTIRASVEKSKFGATRKCEFKVNFSIGVVDRHEEIGQLALDYNIATKPSSVTHEYNGEKWVGFPKFCEAIKDNQQLADELVQKISEARDQKFDAKRQEQEAIKNQESSAGDDLADITKKAKKK